MKRQNDRETQRGQEMRRVNKRFSVIFVTFGFVFVGQISVPYNSPGYLRERQKLTPGTALYIVSSLVCFLCTNTETYVCVCVCASIYT